MKEKQQTYNEFAFDLCIITLIMDIYRQLLKQIYKSYNKNSPLRCYFTTLAKSNISSMNHI